MTVSSVPKRHRIGFLPTSRPGWTAVGVASAAIVLSMLWTVLPLGGWAGLIVGLAGAVIASFALRRDRAIAVFIALVPGILAIVSIVAEITGLG